LIANHGCLVFSLSNNHDNVSTMSTAGGPATILIFITVEHVYGIFLYSCIIEKCCT